MLLDNKARGRFVDALSRKMAPGAEASLLTTDLSSLEWDALRAHLSKLDQTRLLLSTGGPDAPGLGGQLLGGPEERRFRNSLTAPVIARRLDQWLARSTEVRGTQAMVPHSLFHSINAA